MGAVKEQKSPKMSPLPSAKLFLLVIALAAAATASPLEESVFFRLQCYSTCQAASFASTTSCTFGGLFWSTTLTCAQIFPVLSANSGRSLKPTKALAPAAEKPMERGFFRLQCYSTCQAAGFASTTSCTFGGFFWSTTLTCAQIFPVLAANQG